MDDNWVPIIGVLCVFGLPVGAFIVFRVLAHRERMEMIRHGFVPPVGKGGRYAGAVPNQSQPPLEPLPDAGAMLRKGVVLAFIGMALTIGLSFIGYHEGNVTRVGDIVLHESGHWTFGPWLLGGLIPLFIGLGQVTTAFLTDPQLIARYRTAGSPGRGGPPGPGAPPYYGESVSPPGDAATGRSYTYRPDGTQELRPPTPPPSRRP